MAREQIFEIPKSKHAGIYMLYNINNHKVYIGQTTNFKQRATTHRTELVCNRHQCQEVQDDFDKGMEFRFVILKDVGKSCGKRELLFLERDYIYCFLDKGVKLYNHETIEQLRYNIFCDLYRQTKTDIQNDLKELFGMPIPMLAHCSVRKLNEKFENMIKDDKK